MFLSFSNGQFSTLPLAIGSMLHLNYMQLLDIIFHFLIIPPTSLLIAVYKVFDLLI